MLIRDAEGRFLSRVMLGLFLLACSLWIGGAGVRGQGGPPMRRYGWAYINDQGAMDGTLVEVKVWDEDQGAWVVTASDHTQTVDDQPGRYGYPEDLSIEGEPGDEVRFYVAGVEAVESPKTWESGSGRQDLHINQAWLAAGMTAPETVNVGSSFDVLASITNTGRVVALDVTAALTHTAGAGLATGGYTQTVGSIPAGGVRVITWTLSCMDTIPVTLTVTPAGRDGITGEPILEANAAPGAAVVEQQTPAALTATIDAPPPAQLVPVGDDFVVTSTISNAGQANAVDVTAALTHTAGAQLVAGERIQQIGTIPGESERVVSWTLTCTQSLPVTLTVMPAGTDANDGVSAPATPAEVMVDQYDPPYLTTEISQPEEGTYVPVGDSFAVTATITNTGLTGADDVTALVDVQGSALLTATDVPTRSLGALSAGASYDVGWTMTCTDTGAITITVAPAGFDSVSGLPVPPARRTPDLLVLPQRRYRLFLPLALKTYGP